MTENMTVKPYLVVGIDGSRAAYGALEEALRIAGAMKYDVRVICAWTWPAAGLVSAAPITWNPSDDAKATMAAAMEMIDIPEGVAVFGDVEQGDAADLLIEASRGAQMVITGSTGAGMARALFLGSVSTKVAQRSHCPVLVWRPMPAAVKADAKTELAMSQ